MANIIGAYFSCAHDAGDLFDSLEIATFSDYRKHLNQHDVIYIAFSEMDDECRSYTSYIQNIKELLREDRIILELKVGHAPEEAIRQIKDRQYALRFEPRIGEAIRYTGRILAVGIAYGRKEKRHSCKIEVLK